VVEKAAREAVRREYGYRCGYCGVHEEELGGELEVDHFQPRSAGGSDHLDNLVYCCPTCNRLKGDFWPSDHPPATGRCLLHPKRDDPLVHFREEEDGRLTALTETGVFHIERLRLNRPPLVALRRARQKMVQLLRELTAAQEEQTQLRERIASLEKELEKILEQLLWLLGR
jgi:hypothetical protein